MVGALILFNCLSISLGLLSGLYIFPSPPSSFSLPSPSLFSLSLSPLFNISPHCSFNAFTTKLRKKTTNIFPLTVSTGISRSTSARMAAEQEFNRQTELLEAFYTIPSIDKAWMHTSQSGVMQVVVATNQINLLGNAKRKFMSSVHVPSRFRDGEGCIWSPFPFELTGASLIVPSMSGERLLIVRNGENTAKDGSNPVKLEIWNSAQLLKEIVIPPSVHGPVYADGWFEGVSWSQDELYIAYVAEEATPARPLFGNCKTGELNNSSENNPATWKGQGVWQEDWGEAYTGQSRPVLFVANIKSGVVQKVEGVPDDLNAGQVVWAPPPLSGEPQVLVFVGWPSDSGNFQTPRKLGMKYCYNRPCSLYTVEAPQATRVLSNCDCLPKAKKLSNFITSGFSPRFSPDGRLLVFLSAKAAVESGAHSATNSLHSLNWPTSKSPDSGVEVKEVVPVVMQPAGGFPGLYCSNLLPHPWILDDRTILLSSAWCSMQTILAIDIERGKVSRITPPDEQSSWSLLSLHKNNIVAAVSSPAKPDGLKLGSFLSTSADGTKSYKEWTWLDISNPFLHYPEKVEAALSSISYEVLKIPVPNIENKQELTEGAKQPFEAILVSSKVPTNSGKAIDKPPLILVIHGGPHSVSTTSFSRTACFLTALGLNLLFVNYRGSTGFGEEALQSLPGNAGLQDVADVLAALDFAIARGVADPSKVAILGGSHGGFLATHLIGQAPDRFVTAAIRNPVCNLSTMVGTSDIPDWCYVESLGKGSFNAYSEAPSKEDLLSFYEISPIKHVSKVKIPTLFLFGAQDRRVPVSNGLQYVQALRSRGLEVKVFVFPHDMHGIDRPQSDFESFLNIGAWFERFLKPESHGSST